MLHHLKKFGTADLDDSDIYGVVFGAEDDGALHFAPSRSCLALRGVKVGLLAKTDILAWFYAIGHNSSITLARPIKFCRFIGHWTPNLRTNLY